jgi:hypothetical protein
MGTRVPLTIHVNGESKTVGSAVVEKSKTPFGAPTVTATVNDSELADAIQSQFLSGLSIVPAATFGETSTENTMYKVRDALHKAGLYGPQIDRAIDEMQNHGILFRERS